MSAERRPGFTATGYRVRKLLETSWGIILRVKIPRVRGPEGEVGLLSGYERKLWGISEQLLFGFGQGMSLRALCAWLKGFALPAACPSALGEVIQEKVSELSKRREGSWAETASAHIGILRESYPKGAQFGQAVKAPDTIVDVMNLHLHTPARSAKGGQVPSFL